MRNASKSENDHMGDTYIDRKNNIAVDLNEVR
jgi:hypothetical protein